MPSSVIPPFDAVPFEYLQFFQLGGTVEMPEHGAGQLHVVELQATQPSQPFKSREARLGQSFKPRRRIDGGLAVVHARQETKLLDRAEVRQRGERGVAQRLIHVDDPAHLPEVVIAEVPAEPFRPPGLGVGDLLAIGELVVEADVAVVFLDLGDRERWRRALSTRQPSQRAATRMSRRSMRRLKLSRIRGNRMVRASTRWGRESLILPATSG